MFFTGLILLLIALDSSATPPFRYIPEHVFTMDVALSCQPGEERLNLNAVISVMEKDVVTSDDFLGKVVVSQGKHFQFFFRHEEYGTVDPYMLIYHDCGPNVVYERCYAKTEFHFEEPKELGGTVYLNIDLLREPSDLICDKGYPFGRPPPMQQRPTARTQRVQNSTAPLPMDPQDVFQ